jgi:hypothetical protein
VQQAITQVDKGIKPNLQKNVSDLETQLLRRETKKNSRSDILMNSLPIQSISQNDQMLPIALVQKDW